RPSRADVFGAVRVDYKLVLNVLAVAIFAGLFALTQRRGATDPVCGMRVDRAKAPGARFEGRTYAFCSEHCRAAFEADPHRYAGPGRRPAEARAAGVASDHG